MRVALAQLNQTVGDFEGNSRRIEEAYRQALAAGAELVVFPELCLCGYPPLDLLDRRDFLERNSRFLDELAGRLVPAPAIVGCALANQHSRGKPALNTAALLVEGRVQDRAVKSRLPTYDVFDEDRYFEPGPRRKSWVVGGLRLGVLICEDMWEGKGTRPLYHRDPLAELLESGVDLVVNISASPFEAGKPELRQELLAQAARKAGAPAILVNQVGGNDQLIFDGRSLAVDAGGHLLARAAAFQPEVLLVDLERGGPVRPSPCGPEEIFQALVLGLRDFAGKCGMSRAVLGLSGGIDSALCAVLAAEALGPQNVQALGMPSPYSSPASLEDARLLAERLGISLQVLSIEEPLLAYHRVLRTAMGEVAGTLVEENLQARIRGALVMAFANQQRALALATGNKSELATGYCTMYGDMAGAIAPIGDLLKTEVYRVARWLNRERELIPQHTLERPPSAELRPGQLDSDSLPPYELLDPVLEAHVSQGLGRQELLERGFPPELVERVLELVGRSEFKRHQAPPVLRVSGRAFGAGRRLPIARSAQW